MRRASLALLALACACDDASPVEPPPAPPPLTTWVDDWRDEVIYQLLVDRFENGDAGNDDGVDLADPYAWHGGDWKGVEARLDYLEALGVTAIWISPVVENVERGYHGYWAVGFDRPNLHFGDEAALRSLVDAAHARGMKVIVDVVVNHVGGLFFYDLDGDGVEDDGEFNPDYRPEGIDAPIVFFDDPAEKRTAPTPSVFANPDWYGRRGKILSWDDPDQVVNGDFPQGGLKDLKTTLPEVREALVDVYAGWIERTDVDGFRIDTLKHVEQPFWREFCPAIRQRAKELGKERFFLFGEAFDGNYATLGSYTKGEAVDSVVDFGLKFGGFDAVFARREAGTQRLQELHDARDREVGLEPHALGIGIAPRRAMVTFLDNHDVPRFLAVNPSPAALRSALTYLFTYDGVPALYYGTEQELSGGVDPANREDLFATGFPTDGATFRHVARLTRLRRELEPLRRGETTFRWSSERTGAEQDAGLVAFERHTDEERVLVVVSTKDEGSSETSATSLGFGAMQVGFPAGTRLVNVLEDDDPEDLFVVGADRTVAVRVPARGAKVLVPE